MSDQACRPKSAGVCVALLFVGFIALHVPHAHALDPRQHLSQYSHRAWTIREGLIKGWVSSIAQTPDGYLWLGTQFGLVRFDGARAVPWVPPASNGLPSPVIVSLLTGHDGTLWIGTYRGLISWNAGKVTEYKQLAGVSIGALAESPDGTVWASGYAIESNGTLCAIRTAEVHCGSDDRLGHGALGLHVDRSGTLWIAAAGGFWRWAPGTQQFYSVTGKSNVYHEFAEDGDGNLLVPLVGRAARLSSGVIETAYPYPASVVNAYGYRIVRDRDGGDWIGTLSDGLIREHAGDSETFGSRDGLTGDVIATVFEDREGNIWVATDKGLDRFSPNSVATFAERQGLAGPLVSVVATPDGNVWAAAPGKIYRLEDAHPVRVQNLPPFEFAGLYEDSRDRVWVLGPDITGYLQEQRFVPKQGIPHSTAYAMTSDASGDLWISTLELGLVHTVDDRMQEALPWSRFGNGGVATALATDPRDQSIWLGFAKGGISTLRKGHVETLDSRTSGRVSDLRFDADGTLWAATDGGLSRLTEGHVATIDTHHGLPCNRVYWSIRADDRSLWLYSECGLIRVAGAQIDAWAAGITARIHSTLLDASDGVSLFSGDLSQLISPQVAVSSDGNVWFRTFGGISLLRPHQLAVNPVAPPVQIERVVANGRAYDLTRPPSLPSGIRDLAIEYTALSFAAPEKIHFRYRLYGQDSDWREVVNDRRVQYSNLPPGHYRFQVLANNNSGVWNERGATLEFSIAPAYWQTLWFRSACAVVLVITLWLLYQIRLRQIAGEFERTLDARVAERTRIARELHDTLLQSFHGLLLQFQAVSRLFQQKPVEAQRLLDSSIDQAAAAITEGRDAVQGLRNSIEESNNLATAIGNLAEELSGSLARSQPEGSGARPLEIRVDIDGVTKDLHPIVRDEIYRIAAEALRNAVQHSRGKQIQVELHFGRRVLRLRVQDDGIGIDPKVVVAGGRDGHFGLGGMRERAELVGGEIAVWSAQGIGTKVELTVPGARAYTTNPIL